MVTVTSSVAPTKVGVHARAAESGAAKTKKKRVREKLSPAAKREERTGWLFMLPFVLLFLLVFIVPIVYAIYSSFFQQVATGGGAYGGGELVNKFVGLENFQYVITSAAFWAGMGRVLLYTLIQVPIMIISALVLAMLIDSLIVKHVSGFRLGYFLPYAIPGVIASIIWVYLYNGQISPIVKGLAALGINVDFFANNVVLGSMVNITTWTFTGYNMLIFLSALQAIPHELYEAARIDGANGWQIAMKVKLPNVRGAALDRRHDPAVQRAAGHADRRPGDLLLVHADDDGVQHVTRLPHPQGRRSGQCNRDRHGGHRRAARHDLRFRRKEGE